MDNYANYAQIMQMEGHLGVKGSCPLPPLALGDSGGVPCCLPGSVPCPHLLPLSSLSSGEL